MRLHWQSKLHSQFLTMQNNHQIFIYGDSTLRGVLAEHEKDAIHPLAEVWCHPGTNFGRSWRDLSRGRYAARLEECGGLLIIHVGTNDLRRLRGAGVAAAAAKLQDRLSMRFWTSGLKVKISAPLPRTDSLHDECQIASNAIYRHKKGIRHRDFLVRQSTSSQWTLREGLLKPDGLHLSRMGAHVFWRSLRNHIFRLWARIEEEADKRD